MSRPLALFDFDGTITTRDSLLEFIKYSRGSAAFVSGFALNAPVLVSFKIGIISNQLAKERMITHFFGGVNEMRFEEWCLAFAKEKLPSLVRPKAMVEIEKLKQAGAEVAVVSASPENWVRPWCEANGLGCIATQLVAHNGVITGKINGRNCHGVEKVRRIRERFDLSQFHPVYTYGDSAADRPMLSLGTVRFFRPFQ